MQPTLSVLLEPLQRGYRYRYMCEGSAHGPIPGETSTKENKTYPTIRVDNCPPNAVIYLHVSLCTELNEEVHMHNLHGKSVFNGEYLEMLKANERGVLVHSIQGISILQTKNPNKNEVLGCKLAQSEILGLKGIIEYMELMTRWTQPNTEFNSSNFRKAIPNLQDYINLAGSMTAANNVVRLKFRAYVDSLGPFHPLIAHSKPIYDCKTPSTALLKIHRISRCSGSMAGGDEVFLLCDKIERNDIEVIFYIERDGSREFIGNGTFSPTDVFRQFVIIFKTPSCARYSAHTVEAKVCIRRKKNPNEMSPPLDFKFISQNPPYLRREEVMDPIFNTHLQNNFPFPYMAASQDYTHQAPYAQQQYPASQDYGSIAQRPSEPMDAESNFSSVPSYNPHPSFHSTAQPNMYAPPVSGVNPNYMTPVPGDNPSPNPSHVGQLYPHGSSSSSYQYSIHSPHSPFQDPSAPNASQQKYN